jgi:hypothetical protein
MMPINQEEDSDDEPIFNNLELLPKSTKEEGESDDDYIQDISDDDRN